MEVANLRPTLTLLASMIPLFAGLQTASAACSDIVPGSDRECEGAFNGDFFTPTTQWWEYDFSPRQALRRAPVR